MTSVKICNRLGMHVRASSALVSCASRYISEVTLHVQGKRINAKRILAVMSSGLAYGDELKIEVLGEDEIAATQALVALFAAGFGEVSPK